MIWQYNLYALPLFIAASMSAGMALLMMGRRRTIGAPAFAALLMLVAEWSLMDGLEYASADLPSIILWDKATYVGAVSVPVACLIFVLHYTGRSGWCRPRTIALLSVVPAITFLLRLTDEFHHLIYAQYSLIANHGVSILHCTYGTWFYVFAGYSYVLVFFSLALLVEHFSRSHGFPRRRTSVLILCILAPAAAGVIDVLNISHYPFDWTPLAFTLTGVGFFWAFFRLRLFELVPVAHEAIFRGMSDGVFVFDEDNRVADINAAGERIFACSATDVLGRPGDEFLGAHRLDGQYLAQRSSEITLTISGVRRSYDLGFSTLRNKQGRLVGRVGVMRDITDRKRMEDALRTSEAKFRELADLLPQIVFETDDRGVLTFFNRVWLSSTGYSEEDLRNGFDLSKAFPPEDAMRAVENMRRLMSREPTGPEEYRFLRRDGTSFPVMIHSVAILRQGKPVGSRGIIVDLTEQKEMEQRLLRAEHLAGIGETASMVAQDLRNPLQAITVATHVLRGNYVTPEEKNEMLRLIEGGVEYAEATVRDLLDYSGQIHLLLVEVTPRSIIQNALHAVKVPDNVHVQDNSQEQPTFVVDPDRMKRALINLIENATEAMPGGGRLTIGSQESNGQMEIVVSDTGSGIAKQIMENLWKPLQSTKAKGVGLGLPVVKRIVDAHGGEISVKSKSGEGTTFTIRLPINRMIANN